MNILTAPSTEYNVGFNWSVLSDYASTSGALAGFSITLIGVVLGWSVAATNFLFGLTYGKLSVLFFGLAFIYFFTTTGLILKGKECDLFSCPDSYIKYLGYDDLKMQALYNKATFKFRRLNAQAHAFYNLGIGMLYLGLLFLILPYNAYIAILFFVIGIVGQIMLYTS